MGKKAPKKEAAKTPEAQVEEIGKAIVPLSREIPTSIKTEEEFADATSFLTKVKSYIKRTEELQEFFVKPHQDARAAALKQMNNIKALFAPKLEPLQKLEAAAKRMMADYRLDVERKARAEEQRKQDARDRANEKRAEEGKGQILTPVKEVARPDATMKTEEGSATMRKTWKHEVTDRASLYSDRAFLTLLHQLCQEKGLDEQVLRAMVKDGVRQVAGVRIYEDFDVSASAR